MRYAPISAVVAHANAIHGAAAARFDSAAKTWEIAEKNFVAINQATANIRLRLNANEKESQEILKSIEILEAHVSTGVLDARKLPDGHLKLLHLWPVKLLQAGRMNYA